MSHQASRRAAAAFFAWITLCSPAWSQTAELTMELAAPNVSCDNVPVRAMIELPSAFALVPQEKISVAVRQDGFAGDPLPGQIVKQDGSTAELWWVLPQARTGQAGKWTATLSVTSGETPVAIGTELSSQS